MARKLHKTLPGSPGETALLGTLLFVRLLQSDLTFQEPPDGLVGPSGYATIADDQVLAAVQADVALCERTWPLHLDGFFEPERWAQTPPYALTRLRAIVDRIELRHPLVTLSETLQELRSSAALQSSGSFHTPAGVSDMMARMLSDPSPSGATDWVLDPAAGGAALLLSELEEVRRHHGPFFAQALTLVGVELHARTAVIARAQIVLAGAAGQAWVIINNGLLPVVGRDRETNTRRLLTFNKVLANPPFGTSVRASDLAGEPSEVPEWLLYREIPVRSYEAFAAEDGEGAAAAAA